jgi:hypothetical protein
MRTVRRQLDVEQQMDMWARRQERASLRSSKSPAEWFQEEDRRVPHLLGANVSACAKPATPKTHSNPHAIVESPLLLSPSFHLKPSPPTRPLTPDSLRLLLCWIPRRWRATGTLGITGMSATSSTTGTRRAERFHSYLLPAVTTSRSERRRRSQTHPWPAQVRYVAYICSGLTPTC